MFAELGEEEALTSEQKWLAGAVRVLDWEVAQAADMLFKGHGSGRLWRSGRYELA